MFHTSLPVEIDVPEKCDVEQASETAEIDVPEDEYLLAAARDRGEGRVYVGRDAARERFDSLAANAGSMPLAMSND
jgi:hypothetical protein